MGRGEGNGQNMQMLLSNTVLKDAGNISLVRHGASQRNQDKCARTFVHAFILVGQAWQKL